MALRDKLPEKLHSVTAPSESLKFNVCQKRQYYVFFFEFTRARCWSKIIYSGVVSPMKWVATVQRAESQVSTKDQSFSYVLRQVMYYALLKFSVWENSLVVLFLQRYRDKRRLTHIFHLKFINTIFDDKEALVNHLAEMISICDINKETMQTIFLEGVKVIIHATNHFF